MQGPNPIKYYKLENIAYCVMSLTFKMPQPNDQYIEEISFHININLHKCIFR